MDDPQLYAIPDQSGRIALVTGANSGLGLQVATRLALAGAKVVMACRNPDRAAAARARVEAAVGATGGDPDVTVLALDLASQSSVHEAAETARAELSHIDLLVNNAGVMAIPRTLTDDDWETQLATNHLGHFALTGLLADLVEASARPRVVTVSSNAHLIGRIRFDDIDGARHYSAWLAYGQSKLANLLFTLELQRRLTAAGARTMAVAAHPGWTVTNLWTSGRGLTSGPLKGMYDACNRLLGQSDAMGALPTLHAATSPHVTPGGYYGPGGPFGMRGYPVPAGCMPWARDREVARRLWRLSEERTGVAYPI